MNENCHPISSSVASESLITDAPFIVGADLVEFDRADLAIYQAVNSHPAARWNEACDKVDGGQAYGGPLDRLFGDPEAFFIDGVVDAAGSGVLSFGEDPLVALDGFSDALLPSLGEDPGSRDIAAMYDFGGDSHAVVHLHDSGGWEETTGDWSFEHHA